MPAYQGLRARLLLGDEIVLRLVDDLEFLAAQGQAQLVLDGAPALERLVHTLLEEAHALAAVALGAGERDRGVTQHRGGGIAVRGRERDADARRHQDLLASHMEGLAQGSDQPVHEGHDVAEIGDVHEGDGKLVGAEPGDDVALPQRAPDAGRHLAQHLIAAAVLASVVDLLELVDVEADDGDMRVVALHPPDGLTKRLGERAAVGEARQGIVTLQIAYLLFRLAPLLAAHPCEGNGRGDADAEQDERHQRDKAEIAAEDVRLIALIEIDDQRSTCIVAEPERNADDGEMCRAARLRAGIEAQHAALRSRIALDVSDIVAELDARVAAGENQLSLRIVQFVAQHAVRVSGILEYFLQLRREAGLCDRVDHDVRAFLDIVANSALGDERLALELQQAHPARRNEGRCGDDRRQQGQSHPMPIFLQERLKQHEVTKGPSAGLLGR